MGSHTICTNLYVWNIVHRWLQLPEGACADTVVATEEVLLPLVSTCFGDCLTLTFFNELILITNLKECKK